MDDIPFPLQIDAEGPVVEWIPDEPPAANARADANCDGGGGGPGGFVRFAGDGNAREPVGSEDEGWFDAIGPIGLDPTDAIADDEFMIVMGCVEEGLPFDSSMASRDSSMSIAEEPARDERAEGGCDTATARSSIRINVG
jgi:hypothetical protein